MKRKISLLILVFLFVVSISSLVSAAFYEDVISYTVDYFGLDASGNISYTRVTHYKPLTFVNGYTYTTTEKRIDHNFFSWDIYTYYHYETY